MCPNCKHTVIALSGFIGHTSQGDFFTTFPEGLTFGDAFQCLICGKAFWTKKVTGIENVEIK